MPAGKRLAPMLTELVAVLRHFRELDIDEGTAELLVSMSAATIDRRLAGERAKLRPRGRVGTKPGSLLKSQIPIRTWAEWDDAVPGFVEIDTVFHDGGIRGGGHASTLTVTDIATGWTENRSMPERTGKCVKAALDDIARAMPFPILGWTAITDQSSSTTTVHVVCGPQDHLHPIASGQQKRRLSRRAEQLVGGTHTGRLLPLQHRRRTVATQRDLAVAIRVDQLFLPAAEAGVQGPQRGQGVEEARRGRHSVSSRDRSR
ncbi:hypothetical protein [Mycobacterium sp. 852013-50091_SCH5140682]|uniref:hypothetical protein n=1 Tax=Mycobacterium sp. 852013-50091_SCH5140682 TaxID=1834109 RepID=UPI001E36855D|nr:hypothetical protein [Mycobacterium sp. 852013-50091_SCH5140682]